MSATTEGRGSIRTGARARPRTPPPGPAPIPAQQQTKWIVGPWFDLLFFANLTWPIFAILWAVGLTLSTNPQQPDTLINFSMGFWFFFLLSTPHRWITLVLVFLDGDRFKQRPSIYVGIFLLFLTLTLSFASLDLLVPLAIADWIWNAWHFAAQHSGIGRIYTRVANPADRSSGTFEKVVLRVFVLYVIVRLAGAPVIGLDRQRWLWWLDATTPYFLYADYVMVLLPMILMAREVRALSRASLGRFIYMSSVCLMYTAVVVGVHLQPSRAGVFAVQGLLIASGIFHSTEYLAIVTWSVKKRFAGSKEGVFAYLVPRWGLSLGIFALALGLGAWAMSSHYQRLWLIITLFVAYLHYAYDGMIWKARRPSTAAVV